MRLIDSHSAINRLQNVRGYKAILYTIQKAIPYKTLLDNSPSGLASETLTDYGYVEIDFHKKCLSRTEHNTSTYSFFDFIDHKNIIVNRKTRKIISKS